ncbi:MAG: hypothetical protein ACREOS_09210, partial [Candidatus Dormibacteraceae bacterium]
LDMREAFASLFEGQQLTGAGEMVLTSLSITRSPSVVYWRVLAHAKNYCCHVGRGGVGGGERGLRVRGWHRRLLLSRAAPAG